MSQTKCGSKGRVKAAQHSRRVPLPLGPLCAGTSLCARIYLVPGWPQQGEPFSHTGNRDVPLWASQGSHQTRCDQSPERPFQLLYILQNLWTSAGILCLCRSQSSVPKPCTRCSYLLWFECRHAECHVSYLTPSVPLWVVRHGVSSGRLHLM